MWKITILVCVAYLTCRCTNGEITENFIGLPVVYDIPERDNDWDLPSEDIWNEDNFSNIDDDSNGKLLQTLCEKYDLKINNQIIDCNNIKIVPKMLKIDKHAISKRNAKEEEELEGSGEDPPIEIEKEPKEEGQISSTNIQTQQAEPVASEKQTKDESTVDEIPKETELIKNEEPNNEATQTKTEDIKEKDAPIETNPSIVEHAATTSENSPILNEAIVVPSEAAPEPIVTSPAANVVDALTDAAPSPAEANPASIKPAPISDEDTRALVEPSSVPPKPVPVLSETAAITSEPAAVPVEDALIPVETTSAPAQASPNSNDVTSLPESQNTPTALPDIHVTDVQKGSESEGPQNENSKLDVSQKEEDKIKNSETLAKEESKGADKSELGETVGKDQESEDKKGRKLSQESVDNQQSGLAVVNSGGSMIETDKAVDKMKQNAKIESAGTTDEEPKSGESSEHQGRKDNTLLITLFAAVLAVGAAAFAYNFIKKRKNKSRASRTEQNGTTKTEDPEEGREMKPLMTTGEPKNNVEFNDEK